MALELNRSRRIQVAEWAMDTKVAVEADGADCVVRLEKQDVVHLPTACRRIVYIEVDRNVGTSFGHSKAF